MSEFEVKNKAVSEILGEASWHLLLRVNATEKIRAFIERRMEENNDPSFCQDAALLKRYKALGDATPLLEEVLQGIKEVAAAAIQSKNFSQSNTLSKRF